MTAPRVFQKFFEPTPGVAAELRQLCDSEVTTFLESDEYAALREQSEQRWRGAGVDPSLSTIAKHRMLGANAGLSWEAAESLMDEPPADYMPVLLQRAVAATAPPTPTPARLTEEVDSGELVTAQQLAEHAQVTSTTVLGKLRAAGIQPLPGHKNKAHRFRYADVLPILRQWADDTRSHNTGSVVWPENPRQLKVSSKLSAKLSPKTKPRKRQ